MYKVIHFTVKKYTDNQLLALCQLYILIVIPDINNFYELRAYLNLLFCTAPLVLV